MDSDTLQMIMASGCGLGLACLVLGAICCYNRQQIRECMSKFFNRSDQEQLQQDIISQHLPTYQEVSTNPPRYVDIPPPPYQERFSYSDLPQYADVMEMEVHSVRPHNQ